MTSLDLSPLEDALDQLEKGILEAAKEPKSELLRDGVIQRFEYSHELALKFIRRALETGFGESVDSMMYNEVLRYGGRTRAHRERRSVVRLSHCP
jgi:hypothetical protein